MANTNLEDLKQIGLAGFLLLMMSTATPEYIKKIVVPEWVETAQEERASNNCRVEFQNSVKVPADNDIVISQQDINKCFEIKLEEYKQQSNSMSFGDSLLSFCIIAISSLALYSAGSSVMSIHHRNQLRRTL